MPVRRITNGGKKIIGKFPSRKMGKAIWYESLLEKEFIQLAEIDADVIAYKGQPLRIHYALDGCIRTYTPDFLVERTRGKQIVEVKTEEEANKEENIAIFKRAALICQRDGYEFVLATDKTIREEPRLGNVKLLYRYSRTRITQEHQIHAHAFFAKRGKSTLAELASFFTLKGADIRVVYALIYLGVLWVDLAKAICPESIVSMPMAQYASKKEKIA